MGYIGSKPADQVLTGADIQDASIQLADLSTAAQDALGKIDYYGFKKTNGTGNQLEDLMDRHNLFQMEENLFQVYKIYHLKQIT